MSYGKIARRGLIVLAIIIIGIDMLISEEIRQRWHHFEEMNGKKPTKIQLGTDKYTELIREMAKRIPPDFGHDMAARMSFKGVLISKVSANHIICVVE